jgi:hypothetical protein
MNHLDEEQFVQAYYGESDEKIRRHMHECPECRAAYQRLKELLNAVGEYPVPERNSTYGAEVWARLTPHLPLARPRPLWLRWWVLGPALACLLTVAFWAGKVTEQKHAGIPTTARERVLLMAIGDHLERSQVVLTELVHTDSQSDFRYQRERARDLIDENRLLRENAMRMGDSADASLLDELERVLVDVANSPSALPPHDLEAIQQRIESEGLLFKVRVSGMDARQKGQKL